VKESPRFEFESEEEKDMCTEQYIEMKVKGHLKWMKSDRKHPFVASHQIKSLAGAKVTI